jgi:hypothetical protein
MKKKIMQIIPFGILPGFLIIWLLSGKVFDIPRGTHEGGLISSIGVLVIMAFSFASIYLLSRITQSRQKI